MRTLCLEMAPSYLRAMVLDSDGHPGSDRRRVELRRGASPTVMLDALDDMLGELHTMHDEPRNGPLFDRASFAFPGVVKDGAVVTAPGFTEEWRGLSLAGSLAFRLGVPIRGASDADVLGLAVVEGRGVEMALTLGARFGSAIFIDGRSCPSLDLGSHPFDVSESYDERLGNASRKRIGNDKWNRRVYAVLKQLHPIFNYTRVYLGGPNVDKIEAAGLPKSARVVDGASAFRGALRLWDATQ